jgi:trimethylamine---corrinoid protein Co-methyltransferase
MPSLLDRQTLASIHEKAADILATIGVAFETDSARELFKKHGASVHGKQVRIPASLLEQALTCLPESAGPKTGKKRMAAASPSAMPP